MSRHEIPPRWMEAVRQHVRDTRGEERDHLLVYDFTGTSVRLAFEDGSYAFFRDAFCLRDEALREVAVFTEHCGYYFLGSEGLEVEVLDTVRLDVPVEEEYEMADG
ncbi:MAG TPA: hypothetical protein VFT45_26795 [Longimicrobium sp.]|nr:hypothetical protein [Longimicrobium sp.]